MVAVLEVSLLWIVFSTTDAPGQLRLRDSRRDQEASERLLHCTGYRQKCPEPYARYELLTECVIRHLGDLVIPKPVTDRLRAALAQSTSPRSGRSDLNSTAEDWRTANSGQRLQGRRPPDPAHQRGLRGFPQQPQKGQRWLLHLLLEGPS